MNWSFPDACNNDGESLYAGNEQSHSGNPGCAVLQSLLLLVFRGMEGEASVISLLEQKDPNMEHSVIIGINKQLSNIKKM